MAASRKLLCFTVAFFLFLSCLAAGIHVGYAVNEPDASILRITASSSVNLLVSEWYPNGRVVGFEADRGEAVNEIPDASYSGPSSEPQVIVIPNPVRQPLCYRVTASAYRGGQYTLQFEITNSASAVLDEATRTIVAEVGNTYYFILQLSSEGDAISTLTPPVDVAPRSSYYPSYYDWSAGTTGTLSIIVECPVNILVTDPAGRRVGYNPESDSTIIEVPMATYSGPYTDPQVVTIQNPLPGDYLLILYAYGDGAYEITLTQTGVATSTLSKSGVAVMGQQVGYLFRIVEGEHSIIDVTTPDLPVPETPMGIVIPILVSFLATATYLLGNRYGKKTASG